MEKPMCSAVSTLITAMPGATGLEHYFYVIPLSVVMYASLMKT